MRNLSPTKKTQKATATQAKAGLAVAAASSLYSGEGGSQRRLRSICS